MGNSKNGKKGKNIKKVNECDNNHDFLVSREQECFICLQYCEGSLFSLPHWGFVSSLCCSLSRREQQRERDPHFAPHGDLAPVSPHFAPHGGFAPVSPHFAPLFPKVDFPKVDFPKVDFPKVESGKERTLPRLKEQQIYMTVCKCDGWVHNRCLETWVNINKKCPICCVLVVKKPFISKSVWFLIIKFIGCGVIVCALYVIGCALYVVINF